jgi:hypothetical protein
MIPIEKNCRTEDVEETPKKWRVVEEKPKSGTRGRDTRQKRKVTKGGGDPSRLTTQSLLARVMRLMR